jgi:hypothetical protein
MALPQGNMGRADQTAVIIYTYVLVSLAGRRAMTTVSGRWPMLTGALQLLMPVVVRLVGRVLVAARPQELLSTG